MDDGAVPERDENFEQLLVYLKESRGFDFTGYKRASLMRRVRHRMQRVDIEEFDDYLDYLEVHPDEFTELFNTILINVTSFFRDADAWEQLGSEVIPKVLSVSGDGQIRVWSAGCATGEEPYGLAIAFAEALGEEEFRARVKIYATDVDEGALTRARIGAYDAAGVDGLPPTLVGRYFERQGPLYVFRKDLRRSVIFGRNDLVQDAPISRVDLLACRNTLMYFNAEAQARILSRLHFALRPWGILFLGRAEMLLSHGTLFTPIDAKRRFFRKVAPSPTVERRLMLEPRGGERRPEHEAVDELRSLAMHTIPTAHVIVTADGTLGFVNRRACHLLGVSPADVGRPFQDLEMSYRPAELRSMMQAARTTRRPRWLREVALERVPDRPTVLDVQVMPLFDGGLDLVGFSVFFHDVTRRRELQDQLEHASRELESAYGELQSTNEELETTNEELQSTNEELETTNEELQSSNEELETMNEELHSMNEELEAINEELRDRTRDISRLNKFMESILVGIRSALVVIDRGHHVQMWNKLAEELWGLRQEEVLGQPLDGIDSGFPVADVGPVVDEVSAHVGAERVLSLQALNRRGRVVTLDVTASHIYDESTDTPGVLLLMRPVDDGPDGGHGADRAATPAPLGPAADRPWDGEARHDG